MRILVGLAVAALPAFLLAVPEIAGVATWKWVLGVVGLMLFAAAGRRK